MHDRRRVLKSGASLIAGSLLAVPTNAAIFGELSTGELDRDYDQRFWAPNAIEVQQRFIATSAEIARRMPPLAIRYGPGVHQILDVFAPAAAKDAPVFVIVHGGAWRLAMREAHYGPAPAIIGAGCLCVVIGFDCIPAVSLAEMAGQIRQALLAISQQIAAVGGDPGNVHLVGHSSGSHLAALMLTTDWGKLGYRAASLRSATLLSGLYDLYPVALSSRGEYLKLSSDDVAAMSPMRHLDRLSGSAIIAWGANDSPEFKRQSSVFAAALGGMGRLDAMITVPDRNHFEMFEQLYDAGTPLMKATLDRARS